MKYSIIYADPPWSYRDKAHAGQRGAEYKYPCLSTDAVCGLPVAALAAPDAACFLWATFPMLPDALKVMSAWGFRYKTVAFVWVKMNKAEGEFFGMGNWTRANAEVVLLGVKGRPKRVNAAVRQVVRAPVLRHSEKPAEVRERIVTLLGDIPRVELFARERVTGWDSWGNEVESSVVLD